MNSQRLKQLYEFLKDDPNDPFTLYAIATEYNNFDLEKAREFYDKLLEEHEDYVATYYHAAQLYVDLGIRDRAESIYEKGIKIALNQGNHHAHRELQGAFNNFLFEEDD
ncbi:MAG: tetratricopeptide repeat protein [Bacteroidota bacterium]